MHKFSPITFVLICGRYLKVSMKQKLILIGGGGHCKSCIDVIEQDGRFEIGGILDLPERVGEKVLGYPIIGSEVMIGKLLEENCAFFITVGQLTSPEVRARIFETLKNHGITLPVIISPLAHVSPHARIGEGTIVMHHVVVNPDAIIGKNCILNSKCLIEHDVQIGDHCHISTGALINGGVQVGMKSFVGSGAVTKQGITIPSGSFVKANSIIK